MKSFLLLVILSFSSLVCWANPAGQQEEGVYGYPPGAPIQKMQTLESVNVNGEGYESGHLPGTPIQKMVIPGAAKIPDRTIPPVKGVIHLPRLAEVLANLHPDVELNPQSAFWAGAAILTVSLIRAGLAAYTKNPQVAAFIPPVTISNGSGQYKVPSHETYSLEDAKSLSEVLVVMTDEEAQMYADTLDPALVEYMLMVVQAIRMGMAEDYKRACPNPDMCA